MGKRLCMWFLGGKENRKGTALLGEHEQSAACSQSYFTALMEGLLFCGVCVTLPQPLHQQVHKHHQCATLSCFIRAPSKWNLSRVSGALSLQQGQRWWHGAKKARAHFSHLNLKPANTATLHVSRLIYDRVYQYRGYTSIYNDRRGPPCNYISNVMINCTWESSKSYLVRSCLDPCLQGTVDGPEIRRSPAEIGSLSNYSQRFIHPRWLAGFWTDGMTGRLVFDTTKMIRRLKVSGRFWFP